MANRMIGRKFGVTSAALVTAAGIVTFAAPTFAAPVAANAASCTIKSGTSATDVRGAPADGTIFIKGSVCSDFQLTKVGTTGYYTGWLYNTVTGRWGSCSEGAVHITKGVSGDYILCSGVKSGTSMAVTSAGHYSVTAEY
jgi:hypothetical protein